ncbi:MULTISPECIES: maleylpyruvate isomerase family mycothiol-dependent enzyme [Rhodococcus]|uniref:Maleylpyruvate isomerase family mycothiol-dependent enzyme n=1 Tax=Rhodococcus rhodochrous TaxID=1829 RepID=A0A6I6YIM1_RHORH|nr:MULTISPECIES: maleylpyruvate isomerase family mycothiol-dependent enzyme [Rhodococcus]MCB8912339.1 maleylpyruvate isomerase family mycothiol-dependent enzyme [Rhodococcus rhodochrous]MCD2113839.1 maleylpyruvate isomerase family mycothiol-dependent enzyme [Rhodococcus rhodochrous]MDC3728443.1 maleylpyruvate isomerase family mycothiol-dependent enzyme [Rhodococcus sp. Rp3]MDJ0400406.1 maleylpyruvate isomerase family mycothiol-dependent enzyme [Rhodococcus rhodochrous]QHG84294.1 maleylpyruvate
MTSQPDTTPDTSAAEFPIDTIRPLLLEQFAVLDDLLAGLTEDEWTTATCLPGWTVKDITAHLIGTESMLAGIEAPRVERDVRSFDHVRNDIAAFNELWVESLRPVPGADVLERYREIVALRTEQLGAMTQEDFGKQSNTPVGPAPYGRFMRIRVFDCWLHELDICDALGRTGSEGGPRAELGSAEVFGAVPFIVGKRGKAPEGARITLELTGPLARTIHIEVHGRATEVPALSEPVTTTIAMDSGLFVRLAGGRVRAEDRIEEISLGGDTEVGRRIVDNLAFTI